MVPGDVIISVISRWRFLTGLEAREANYRPTKNMLVVSVNQVRGDTPYSIPPGRGLVRLVTMPTLAGEPMGAWVLNNEDKVGLLEARPRTMQSAK